MFENWESEFLQMAVYVWLTSFLYQRGSAESKDPDEPEEVDEESENHRPDPQAPYGPFRSSCPEVYETALFSSFRCSLYRSCCIWLGAPEGSCPKTRCTGKPVPASLDTWEAQRSGSSPSELAERIPIDHVLVVLSIFLRQKGSPESKPVHAPTRRRAMSAPLP